MKLKAITLFLSTIFLSQTIFASATCTNVNGQGSVRMYNSPLIEVEGLESVGVSAGFYKCQVAAAFMMFMSTSICTNKDKEQVTLISTEGINMFGQHTASSKLMKNGVLVFDSNCLRD